MKCLAAGGGGGGERNNRHRESGNFLQNDSRRETHGLCLLLLAKVNNNHNQRGIISGLPEFVHQDNVMGYYDGVNGFYNLTSTTTNVKIFFRACPLGQEWRPEICDCECPRNGDRAACRFGQSMIMIGMMMIR